MKKAFLINRPAPLEFDKNRGERDLINPRSFQFGVFCMSEECFLQRSQAGPSWFAVITFFLCAAPTYPSLPGELARRTFSEVIWILIQIVAHTRKEKMTKASIVPK